jgi:hypothetical protein
MAVSKKYKHKFTIDRATWRHGHQTDDDFGSTALLNEQGMQCCIGFLAESCGVSRKALRNVPVVDDLPINGAGKVYSRLGIDSDVPLGQFYSRNDSTKGNRIQREQKLTTMFRDLGIGVKFVGKYPEPPVKEE